MRIGSLRNQVSILQPPGTQDSIGQPVQTWTPLAAAVWADIRHLSGVETIKAEAQTAVGLASIRIRYRTDITTKMRVQHGSTVYEITAVLPDLGKRQHVDLTCKVIT